ncbi:MAG: hypothetical protein EOS78_09330, partial [Mesorhizobium sp.]
MTMAQQKCTPAPDHRWISWLADGFGWLATRKKAHLDIRDLSPHLQRDLGFLDGNDP